MTNQELSQYMQDLQKQIQTGLTSNYTLKGDIEIELSVISKKDFGGGFKILVAEGAGKYRKEELSKIKFKIGKKPSVRITGAIIR